MVGAAAVFEKKEHWLGHKPRRTRHVWLVLCARARKAELLVGGVGFNICNTSHNQRAVLLSCLLSSARRTADDDVCSISIPRRLDIIRKKPVSDLVEHKLEL